MTIDQYSFVAKVDPILDTYIGDYAFWVEFSYPANSEYKGKTETFTLHVIENPETVAIDLEIEIDPCL